MAKNYLAATLLTVVCLVVPSTAKAQDDEPGGTMVLDTVVVTAGRGEESVREVTTNITVIDRQAIERAPTDRLDHLLRREGIHVIEYPGQRSSTIQLRGFRTPGHGTESNASSRVLVLIDGRQAPSSDLATMTKINVERIEIIRGPAAVQYGSNAMGGVINVITRRGEGDLSAQAKVGFGSYSFYDQEGGLNGRAGMLDYSVGLYRSQIDDFRDANGETREGTDSKWIYSGSLNLGLNWLEDRHRLGLTAGFFDDHIQSDGGSRTFAYGGENHDSEMQSYDLLYTGRDEDDFLSWQARYYHLLNSYSAYNSRARTQESELAAWGGWGFWPNTQNKAKTDGFQAQMKASWDMLDLTGGVDWQKNEADYISGLNTPLKRDYEMTDNAALLLAKLKLLDDSLILSGGIRYDDFEQKQSGQSKSIDNWAPSIGVAYHPADWLKLRTNYSEGFRIPSADELLQNYSLLSYGSIYEGNTNLDPEKNKTFEVGFDVNTEYWQMDFTYFHIKYENYIREFVKDSAAWITTYSYENARHKTTFAGFEFGTSFLLGSYLGLGTEIEPYFKGTIFTRRRTYDNDSGRELTATFTPKTTLAYGIDIDVPDYGLFVNLNASYTSSMYDTSGPGGGANPNDPRNLTDSYTTVDLSLEKTIATFADNHKIGVELAAYNIFDKYYEPKLGYPSPGANYYIGLRYDYN